MKLTIMLRQWTALLCALPACSSPSSTPAQVAVVGADVGTSGPDAAVSETRPLGMNDVSILLPLPDDPERTPVVVTLAGFGDGSALVPADVLTLLTGGDQVVAPAAQYHAVAIRFDLCDRVAVGPCAVGADGQMRVTFQPLRGTIPTEVADTALHLTYVIPAAELASVVTELRALGRIQAIALDSPLIVNPVQPVTAGSTEYLTRLCALVARYARADNILRLTIAAEPSNLSGGAWEFSGLEPVDGTLTFFDIPTVTNNWLTQDAFPTGTRPPSFGVSPVMDNPAGFVSALDSGTFTAGSAAAQMAALGALADTLNPTTTTIKTVQCLGCHVSTFMEAEDLTLMGALATSVPGTFTPTSTHDLTIAAGFSASDPLSFRAFGWREQFPEISQRVANETAMVIDEIESRFPPAPP